MPPKKPKQVRQPGSAPEANPDPEAGAGTESDIDAALAAGQAGKTHKISKARAPVAPSKVKGDPDRPKAAPVNDKPQMKYADAMKALAAAEELRTLSTLSVKTDEQKLRIAALEKVALKRSVLTEQGWVVMPNRQPPAVARA